MVSDVKKEGRIMAVNHLYCGCTHAAACGCCVPCLNNHSDKVLKEPVVSKAASLRCNVPFF